MFAIGFPVVFYLLYTGSVVLARPSAIDGRRPPGAPTSWSRWRPTARSARRSGQAVRSPPERGRAGPASCASPRCRPPRTSIGKLVVVDARDRARARRRRARRRRRQPRRAARPARWLRWSSRSALGVAAVRGARAAHRLPLRCEQRPGRDDDLRSSASRSWAGCGRRCRRSRTPSLPSDACCRRSALADLGLHAARGHAPGSGRRVAILAGWARRLGVLATWRYRRRRQRRGVAEHAGRPALRRAGRPVACHRGDAVLHGRRRCSRCSRTRSRRRRWSLAARGAGRSSRA